MKNKENNLFLGFVSVAWYSHLYYYYQYPKLINISLFCNAVNKPVFILKNTQARSAFYSSRYIF